MVDGEVLWLDVISRGLNVKDAKGSVHIIRVALRGPRKIEKGNKVEVGIDGNWAKYIKKRFS
jgi:hypothetical protein